MSEHFIEIRFKNDGCIENIINMPIIFEDKPIGVITNVTEDWIDGLIWTRYLTFEKEMIDNRMVSIEMILRKKREKD